jgi:hypothetical protein
MASKQRIRSALRNTALTTDAPQISLDRRITFKHPGYNEFLNQNELFRMYAWDGDDTHGLGLHAGTALLACRLVACNTWDGYLTTTSDGVALQLEQDDLLTETEYFFHVPRPADAPSEWKYPIYPTFNDWAFPHTLPPTWPRTERSDSDASVDNAPASSSVSSAVLQRDRACVVSADGDGAERAHLCPRSELEWFTKCNMARYNNASDISGDTIIDDMANAVALRSDIHKTFDDRKFAFIPKGKEQCWVAHFFEDTRNLGGQYHNRRVSISTDVPTEFILARFAWTVFPRVRHFVERGPPRVLRITQTSENGEYTESTKTMGRDDFIAHAGPAQRGRSGSPKKHKPSSSLNPIAECSFKRFRLQVSSLAQDNDVDDDVDDDEDATDTSESLSILDTPPRAHEQKRVEKMHAKDTEQVEAHRLSTLRMRARKLGRPTGPATLCCDYTLAERANALGLPGRQSFGGGHLCMQCLGYEELDENKQEELHIDE